MVWLLVLGCLLMACTTDAGPGATTADAAGTADAALDDAPPAIAAGAPDIPVATEPAGPEEADPGAQEATVAPDAPQAGSTVLLHLEGPISDREATDVVIRNEAGEEVERYRLPGAIGVWAAPGASTALVYTLPGGWARYDARSGQLALVRFPDTPPGPTIQPASGIAGPTALWTPLDTRWLLRMDTGDLTDLDGVAADAVVQEMSGDGAAVVLRTPAEEVLLLLTAETEVRPLDARSASLTADGAQVVTVDAAGQVSIQSVDGGDRTVLGSAAADAAPVALPDGRVLLTGADPRILGPGPAGGAQVPQDASPEPDASPDDGRGAALDPTAPLSAPVRVAADGSMALATTASGLALVDLGAGTVTPLPDTAGFAPVPLGPASVLWAVSVDPLQPGGLVVDPATGGVARFLEDQETGGVLSVSADGRRITLAVGTVEDDDTSSVVVDADGTVSELGISADRLDARLHPDGQVLAVATVEGRMRFLHVGVPPLRGEAITTGRNPVWLVRRDAGGPVGRPTAG